MAMALVMLGWTPLPVTAVVLGAPGPVAAAHGWYTAKNLPGVENVSGTPLVNEGFAYARVATRQNGSPCALWSDRNVNTSVERVAFSCWDKLRGVWSGLGNSNGPDYLQDAALNINVRGLAVTVDTNNNPHAVWVQTFNKGGILVEQVVHQRWTGSVWRGFTGTYDVLYTGANSLVPQVAINPVTQRPAVFWSQNNLPGSQTLYSEWNGTAWTGRQTTTPDVVYMVGAPMYILDTNLVFDVSGAPIVVFSQTDGAPMFSNESVLIRTWAAGGWRSFANLPDPLVDHAIEPSLALGPSGRPGVAYVSTAGGQLALQFIHWDGTVWKGMSGSQPDTIVPARPNASVWNPDLEFQLNGDPVVVWSIGESPAPLKTGLQVGTWQPIRGWGGLAGQPYEQIVSDRRDNGRPSVQLDVFGRPEVVFVRRNAPGNTYDVFFTHWL